MSRLLRAISEMLPSPPGRSGRGREPERFRRSESKKLIQQEAAPAAGSPSSRDRAPARPRDPDTEPINEERAPAKPCIY